ncbi:MAG TPA: leucyl aminopeptidase, partial [Thermoplasmata archaeon]|nr:leucyl aminopeptidase [Thermoplasmata archaeon]
MKVALDRREATAGSFDASVSGVFERSDKDDALPRTLGREDGVLTGTLRRAWDGREVRGKLKEIHTLFRPDGRGRVVLVGLGRRPLRADTVREVAATAVQKLKGHGVRTVAFRLASFVGEGVTSDEALRALASGALLGGYEFLRYKSSGEGAVEEVTIALGEEHAREEGSLKRSLEQELVLADSALFTRDLANTPPNHATPEWLAEQARHLGKELGLKVAVFDEKKLEEMQCGGILAVGSGSAHPPRMIVVEYSGGARSGKTVAVVGKGITFDSGGISIKPSLGMAEMKFDKSGACAVLGIVRAASLLKVPPRVVGVMACAENLPSGSAYRPSDVVRTYNGKTIEVTDTDAEGRVVLADALAYAVDKYHPDEVIDLATLTGAQVVALGENIGAVVGNRDPLAQALEQAGQAVGEPLWQLPLTDPHRDMVKSDVADVRNALEPKYAGCLLGAAFLENFVGDTAWAHLDIAGPAWARKATLKWVPAYHPLG